MQSSVELAGPATGSSHRCPPRSVALNRGDLACRAGLGWAGPLLPLLLPPPPRPCPFPLGVSCRAASGHQASVHSAHPELALVISCPPAGSEHSIGTAVIIDAGRAACILLSDRAPQCMAGPQELPLQGGLLPASVPVAEGPGHRVSIIPAAPPPVPAAGRKRPVVSLATLHALVLQCRLLESINRIHNAADPAAVLKVSEVVLLQTPPLQKKKVSTGCIMDKPFPFS